MALMWNTAGASQRDIHTALSLVTAPTTEPVTVDDFKSHSRIDADEEDASTITGYLKASRKLVETYLRRQLITATYRFSLDRFPCDCIELPLPPVQSVSALAYVDSDGTTQTWDSSNYRLDTYSEPARIEPAYNVSWPTIRCVSNAVNVTFVCGYGAAGAVPDTIKTAIKITTAVLFEMRDVSAPLPEQAKHLLMSERWGSYP